MNEVCAVCGHPADLWQPALRVWICNRPVCYMDAWDKFLPHYALDPEG